MVRVIINADDLGKNQAVNAAIADGISRNCITSTTILANTTLWDEVHNIVSSYPHASYGVHLNLTEGKSLLNSEILRLDNIIDEQGNFTGSIRKTRYWKDRILNSIYEEWDAQIHLVKNIEGIAITHLDGHHHIHNDLIFAEILEALCKKHGIQAIRNKYHSPINGLRKVIGIPCKLMALIIPCSNGFQTKASDYKVVKYMKNQIEYYHWRNDVKSLIIPDYFDSYESALKRSEVYNGCRDNEVLELMCHPGHPNYSDEFSMVMRSEFQRKSECILISYKDLISE